MELKKLDRKVLFVWLIRTLFIILPVLIAYIVLCFAIPNEGKILAIVIGGVISLITVGLCVAIPILRYHFYTYGRDEKRVYINKGIIFRHRIIVPICQIQDLHLVQGPIMMIFKLSSVLISTAGSNYIINGLANEEAKMMIDELENKLYTRLEELKDE